MKWRSEWHSPAATVRTSTSCGPTRADLHVVDDELAGDLFEHRSFHAATLTPPIAHVPVSRLVAALEIMVYRRTTLG